VCTSNVAQINTVSFKTLVILSPSVASISVTQHKGGIRGSAVGSGTALQTGSARVPFPMVLLEFGGTRWRREFRHCATSRKIGGSIPDGIIGIWGQAVEQLVEALRYKSEGRGFDSRWCHWNISLT
jgi:hypothetical protein